MALKRSFSHVEVECDEENYKRVCDELETVRNSILKRFEQCFYLGNTFDGTYAGDLVFFRVNDDNSKLWAKMFIEHLESDDHEYFSDFSTVDKLLDDNSNGRLNGINKVHYDVREYRQLPKLNVACLEKCSFLPDSNGEIYDSIIKHFEYIMTRVATHCTACNGDDLERFWWGDDDDDEVIEKEISCAQLEQVKPILDYKIYNYLCN